MIKTTSKLTALQVERAFDSKMAKDFPGPFSDTSVTCARLGSTQGFLECVLARLSQKDLREIVEIHGLNISK